MMNVDDVFNEAQKLSPEERKELIQRLSNTLESDSEAISDAGDAQRDHRGQSLVRKLEAIGSIEMKYPEIDDPVAWVKHLRAEQRKRRLAWDGDST